jgi:hypothetical protein
VARPGIARVSRDRIARDLREAARTGDRASLARAVDEMRTLALSPRYWRKYLGLLRNPLARLVDLLVIKQGDRIAHQKGWTSPGEPGRRPAPDRTARPPARRVGPPPPEAPAAARKGGARRAVADRPAPGPDRARRRPRPATEQPSLF